MTAFNRSDPSEPQWTDTRLQSGRGNVRTGIFDKVFYLDVHDGPQGLARVRNLRLPQGPTNVSQVISTGHEVALEEERSETLLLPLSGRIFCATGSRDLVARPGQAMVLPRGLRRTVTLRDGAMLFRAIVLRLPDLSLEGTAANGATLDLGARPDLASAAALLADLLRPGGVATAALSRRVEAAETLVAGALSALVPPAEGRVPTRGAERALQHAQDMMREQFAEAIAIRDIAAHSGLSMRQLQHLFARAHGISPHAWLTRLRLEQAHLLLKGAPPVPSVTEAALASGLAHLGRFPAAYRARFGTLPSQERAALR